MKTDAEILELLKLAELAAREAGAILAGRNRDLLQVNVDEGKDFKLQADVAAEKIIRELLNSDSEFSILGEEMGYDGTDIRADWQWIVDPLDGTANYLRGVPACCVSIALWQGMNPVLGVVYDFNSDEMFSGNVLTKVATLNDMPISVSSIAEPPKAILSTGFPLAMNLESETLAGFIERVQSFKKIRMIGSATLGLTYVACGRFDAYQELSGRLWDVAAGIALINAAGGHTELIMTDGEKFVCDVRAAGTLELLSHC